jgi:tryptophan-rich hypothetical protein
MAAGLASVDGLSMTAGKLTGTRKRSASAAATAKDLRRLALALPDAVETITWGEPHFRIHNKIFTGLGTREGRAVTSVKLEKADAEVRLFDPRFRPAPYVGRYGWLEFVLEEVTVGELEALIAESYRLVAKEKAGKKPGTRAAATSRSARPLSPKKLLHTKWTAVAPRNKEKHFLVTKVVEPQPPGSPVVSVEIEAVHSKRTRIIEWRELTDAARWRRGWVT